ncbi:Ig-like domain-containing protein [Clostridium thailandense]|uniref:Ig-like domain-containing protein n=1 Tax=Clostridium thailandense TaxID=2794346 RepID=UPI003989DDAC
MRIRNYMSKILLIFAMVLAFGILEHTSVQAATIGQQLTTPESRWQRVYDTNSNISYLGANWATWNNDNLNCGSIHVSNNGTSGKGLTVRFNFTGSKLRLISFTRLESQRYSNNIQINIDNNVVKSFSEYYDETFKCLVFEEAGLSNFEHFVTVSCLDDCAINLDAIDIDSVGQLKPYNSNIVLTAVSLNKASTDLTMNTTDTLVATVTPDNATNKIVTWISSDPTVATVDSTGKVTAVKEGIATITATTT